MVDLDVYMWVFSNEFDAAHVHNCIGAVPCTVIHDFCSAFLTVLHDRLVLILDFEQVLAHTRNVTHPGTVHAHRCVFLGCGDGSFFSMC